MPTRPIDMQDHRLRYLHLSHDKGSMRAAAEALGVATSSVSRQIARLEEELDIELVRPGTHRISLTAAGEAAVDYYVERLRQHSALIDRLDELRQRQQASTVIAIGEGLLAPERSIRCKASSTPTARTRPRSSARHRSRCSARCWPTRPTSA